MRVPRWATFPAIAIILGLAIVSVPEERHNHGAALEERTRVENEQRNLPRTEQPVMELDELELPLAPEDAAPEDELE